MSVARESSSERSARAKQLGGVWGVQKILHFRHSGCLEIVLLVPHQMNIYTFLREEIGLFGSLE